MITSTMANARSASNPPMRFVEPDITICLSVTVIEQQPERLLGRSLPGEFLRSFQPPATQLSAKGIAGRNVSDRLSNGLNVFCVHQDSCVSHNFAKRGVGRGHNGCAARHSLQGRQAEAFV